MHCSLFKCILLRFFTIACYIFDENLGDAHICLEQFQMYASRPRDLVHAVVLLIQYVTIWKNMVCFNLIQFWLKQTSNYNYAT